MSDDAPTLCSKATHMSAKAPTLCAKAAHMSAYAATMCAEAVHMSAAIGHAPAANEPRKSLRCWGNHFSRSP